MKFSLKWLNDFVDTRQFFNEPELLLTRLTQAGFEVEAFENQKIQFKNVLVAQIESVEKHPQADRLTLCKVSTGNQIHSIVCGAKNHKKGDKVVIALPGATLPENFVIKKTRIRGVDSHGMLASKSELGFKIKEKEEGIWILEKDVQIGINFSEYLGQEDIIFDICIPPNRSDCLSHKGLAREISCLFSLPFLTRKINLVQDKSLSVQKSIKVEVIEKQACPQYYARLITNVKISESPKWLKTRLKSLGLKSINNVVDVTNFVLRDRGQALHAFDRDKITSITVDKSKKGEKFFSLDEKLLVLTGEELTIRDKDKVLALAGIIGGINSIITDSTKNIFIESAYFSPESIRRTSRRFGIETDSSYHFMRGIDPTTVQEAMDLACELIQKLAGTHVSGDFYDLSKKPTEIKPIEISLEDLESRLGYRVLSEQFLDWMKRIKCRVQTNTDSISNKQTNSPVFTILPPSFRQDLKIKEDLIEEFARLEGYDKIPDNKPPSLNLPKDSDPSFLNHQKLISFLSGRSWYQAINYSFCDPIYYKEFLQKPFYLEDLDEDLKEKKQTVSVKNPISSQLSLMKPLLIPDLVKNIVSNFRHNNKYGQLFEVAPIFYQEEKSYKQEMHLSLTRFGNPLDIWKNKNILNFYHLKSEMESLLDAFSIRGYIWETTTLNLPFIHPKQVLILKAQNKLIGFIGSFHPGLANKYKIPLDVSLGEFNLDTLLKMKQKNLKFKVFSNLLTVEKDLCFVIPLNIPVGKVKREIKKSLGSLCEKIEIFDIYQKQEIRSVSFRMFLTPKEKSWTDKELQDFLNKVIETVYKKFSIKLK